MSLVDLLKQQEGFKANPYECHRGFQTIGYGRNLETNGLDEEEAEYLLLRDIARCRQYLAINLYFFPILNPVRQDALVSMAFQLGRSGLMNFKKMLFAISESDFNTAKEEALDSEWAKQTPERAEQVAEMIRTGEY